MKNASGFKAAHLRYPRVQMGQKPYIFHECAAKRVELSRSGDNSNVQGAFESTKNQVSSGFSRTLHRSR